MNEKKFKHLDYIQNIITRMNSNSFLIKGWGLTLISALFALASKDANLNYILITGIVLPAFWILDGFFISTERQFRHLYDDVRNKDEEDIDFSMNISSYGDWRINWFKGIFSRTLIPYYGTGILSSALVFRFITQA